MIISHDDSLTIERSEQFKQNAFTIRPSREAFEILSGGLYQDRILAVIRELSTNAYDAHVAAELNGIKDRSKRPFDVTLPSKLNPIFKIRDYGTGLSESDIFNIYTTYFGSTKQDSNDFIGALGLGSKSPFSIVSSFLVISFFNNIKTV
jgi:HSP90 family molecular chaperone